MESERLPEFLVECFWPEVEESDLLAIDERAGAYAADLNRSGGSVRYLGSLLMCDDEVVLCRFEGSESSVRAAAEQAGIPFERIVRATRSPVLPEHVTPDQTRRAIESYSRWPSKEV